MRSFGHRVSSPSSFQRLLKSLWKTFQPFSAPIFRSFRRLSAAVSPVFLPVSTVFSTLVGNTRPFGGKPQPRGKGGPAHRCRQGRSRFSPRRRSAARRCGAGRLPFFGGRLAAACFTVTVLPSNAPRPYATLSQEVFYVCRIQYPEPFVSPRLAGGS